MVIRRPSQQWRMILRRRNTIVGGKCALPSAVLVTTGTLSSQCMCIIWCLDCCWVMCESLVACGQDCDRTVSHFTCVDNWALKKLKTVKKVKYVKCHECATTSRKSSLISTSQSCSQVSANTARPWIRVAVSRRMLVYSPSLCQVLIQPGLPQLMPGTHSAWAGSGWVGLGAWFRAEVVYMSKDGHPLRH